MRVAPVVYSVKETPKELLSIFSSLRSDPKIPETLERQVRASIRLLQEGGVVAFPTDTLYGLGADFASTTAVQRVLAIKGRSADMGLPLLLCGPEQLPMIAGEPSEFSRRLALHFWPGALTLVVRRSAEVSDLVTGGRDTVAVRVPDHPIPRALAQSLGRPITGTSANLTGAPPSTTAQEVWRQLGARVDHIIDGGPSPLGRASTILDVSGPVPRMVRAGAITLEALRRVYPGSIE
ncbi:MAG: threonylcarbamoyl-AMP synthase [Chloroflexi bacterium]|nr:threonylcarbamoyl-AMP synthase [Chloroflexota bacterium]MBI4197712.1 threonylcarbamoyl-AMP synthase [Chloroflexota bacterium]